ncbi:dihydrodipicolinate synthase [mine drainage metagenome]|uniref:Dihydrodipicolinate synthase n=1 Tax=mine drainage metagenome TaxID=410659 RepID=T0ZWS7_9ZZZZ
MEVDLPFLERHVRWLLDSGCAGVVVLGSLGEAPALTAEEKMRIVESAVRAAGRMPVLVGISAYSTADAARLARAAEEWGASGLMVLPPYVYHGDAREVRTHFSQVFRATRLPCMLYNNPIAYGTDIVPDDVEALARDNPNLVTVKESSGDVRRITDLGFRLGSRVARFVGIDDQILEGMAAGASGWVAGLANALPRESVALFEASRTGRQADALARYRWFLPLLRLDADPKFVQLIKLVQQEVGMGSSRVRPPRLELDAEELDRTRRLIQGTLSNRPNAPSS